MNLFEFFLKSRNRSTESWVEATATFTGKRNRAARKAKTGFHELEYYEYEITYLAKNKERRAFYTFYPLPDPTIEEIEGKTMKIKYNKKKPYMYRSDDID